MHESQTHERNCFITLTYDDAHYPENHSVHVRDWQLFAKRLRKKIGRFRFFMCAEYGEQTFRPHYHALIFGHDFLADRVTYKTKPHRLWTSPTLTETWGQGFAIIGALTYESAAYCARYVMKKVNGDLAKQHYERIDADTGEIFNVRPEFVTMSRRPGIGAPWLAQFKTDVYPSDQVVIRGKTFRPPRYYDDSLSEPDLQALKKRRRHKLLSRSEELTPERLAVREQVLAATLKTLSRKLS